MGLRIAGSNPSGEALKRMRLSPNYRENGFANLSPTPMMHSDASFFKIAVEFFRKSEKAKPPGPLPSIKTDLTNLSNDKAVIVWFGHSSYFIRIHHKNYLVDPVFSGNASPLLFMVKAFPGSDIYTVDEMPSIDYLILTHDHYDHLDYKTLRRLQKKVGSIYCSLGMGSHLKYWGFAETRIHELDWWEERSLQDGSSLIAAPARHFSGRGVKRYKTLWSSFILKTPQYRLYLGGDSGYDEHFKLIGKKFGPFDMAMLESGQYNTMWPLIHMMPEETVQAAADLQSKVLLPVHWGKFSLAMHDWDEPVKRVLKKAEEIGMKITTPKVGEPVILDAYYPASSWWEF